jgi:hypothetical protein
MEIQLAVRVRKPLRRMLVMVFMATFAYKKRG